MIDGYIKLHRQLIKWEWFGCGDTLKLFIYCLLMANWEPKKWKGIPVKRGQFITSYARLSDDTCLTIQKVRTSLERLELTQEVTRESTSQYTIISVLNYDDYQDEVTQEVTHEATNQQQTDNKQITTTKNIKELKESKYIYKEFLKFCPFNPFEKAADLPPILQDEIQRIMKQPFLTLKLTEKQQLDFIDYWFTADAEGYLVCMDKAKNFNPSRKASNWKKYNDDDENLSDSERLKKLLEED